MDKIITQAKIPRFDGDKDNYFEWRSPIIGFLHKGSASITQKMLYLTSLLDISKAMLRNMIPVAPSSASTYSQLVWALEGTFGGEDRFLNYLLRKIKSFRRFDVGDPISLNQLLMFVREYIDALKRKGEQPEGRTLFSDVYHKLPLVYQGKYREWHIGTNERNIMAGIPVEGNSLQTLLTWADQYLRVLREADEISDFLTDNKRPKVRLPEPSKRMDPPRKPDAARRASSGRFNKATEERASDTEVEDTPPEDTQEDTEEDPDQDDVASEDYDAYWTKEMTEEEECLDYDDDEQVYLAYKFTQKIECVMCKEAHSVRRCPKFEKLTPDDRKQIAMQKQVVLQLSGRPHTQAVRQQEQLLRRGMWQEASHIASRRQAIRSWKQRAVDLTSNPRSGQRGRLQTRETNLRQPMPSSAPQGRAKRSAYA